MKQRKNRTAAVNQFYLLAMSIISVYLSFAKASSILFGKGESLGTVVCFVLTIALVIGNVIIYLKNRESTYLKVTMFLTYLFANCFLMYSGKNISTYAYLFQGMICSILFFNLRYVVFVVVLTNLANIIDVAVIYGHVNDPTILLVHLASVVVFSVILICITRISNHFNEEAMNLVMEEKNQQKLYAARGIELGKATEVKVKQVNELASCVDEASGRVAQAIQTITDSTRSTAESLQ